jgi:hypothetical protein
MGSTRSFSILTAFAVSSLVIAPAAAELPPPYTTWADFAAVTAQDSIPRVLGVVDRIERRQAGKYIARAGACFVEITVIRESAKGPDGKIIVGPSHIARVEVGEKHCDQ